jgi:uncharacterized protein involved in response to NO
MARSAARAGGAQFKDMELKQRPRFTTLCAAEPFRIFFPLATLLGISGVSLWPLFFSGLHQSFYPGLMHSRLMIHSFLGGFVFGFLGTAMPRLLSAPPLRAVEVWTLVALHVITAGFHIAMPRLLAVHPILWGDAAFLVQMLCFAAILARRLRSRVELPPPGFVLVAFGLASGFAGTLLWLAGMKGWVGGDWMLLGNAMLNEGFVLFLILGAGSFLIPRFLRIAGVPELSDERRASPAWRRRALFAAGAGSLLLGGFFVTAFVPGSATLAAVLRSAAIAAYLPVFAPIHRTPEPLRTVPLCVLLGMSAIFAGLLFPLAFPMQRVAGLHIVYLGGFSLITFTVATRVVLGHSGNAGLFDGRVPALLAAAALLITGTVLRTAGDFATARPEWLSGASYAWMLAALIWSFAILPKVRQPDSSGELEAPRCSRTRR